MLLNWYLLCTDTTSWILNWKLSILGFFRIVSLNEVNRVKTVLLELSCVMYVVFLSIGIYSVDLPSPPKNIFKLKVKHTTTLWNLHDSKTLNYKKMQMWGIFQITKSNIYTYNNWIHIIKLNSILYKKNETDFLKKSKWKPSCEM